MQRYTLLLAFVVIAFAGFGQSAPQYSHNMFNIMSSNPGYVGGQGKTVATVIARQQWMGFEGKPQTNLLSLDVPFKIFGKKSGLGLTIVNDIYGFDNNFYGRLGYAYRKRLSFGELGLGMDFGILSRGFKWDQLNYEGTDLVLQSVQGEKENRIGLDMNVGAFFQSESFYAGLSVVNFNNPTLNYQHASIYFKRHITFTAGYEYALPIPMLTVTPSVFVKTDAATTQFSINALATYNKKFWGGVSYRAGDAVIVLAGIELRNHLKIGYAYDLTMSKLRKVSNGSHEIYLSYAFELQLGKDPERYRSVRFL